MEGELLFEFDRNEVEKREHRKDCDKHVVIDDRWISCVCFRDHVADEGHDDECEEELCAAQAELQHVRHCCCEDREKV